ncbi:FecR family protein [Pedobacter gandavensis]|uniref:FecR family protein n=1 Tax=Pedobacter gandavensis TaxID=2679963 RepID=UPI00292F5D0B|nr:FecR domain-containing protein [Pedobacter gandavensis]
MNEEEVKILLEKYHSGTSTAREIAIVESWYNTVAERNEPLPVKEDLELSMHQLWDEVLVSAPAPQIPKVYPLWKKAAAVAAMLTGITLALYFLETNKEFPQSNDALTTNVIDPGKNKAILRLKNGNVVQLSETKTGLVVGDSMLTYNDGTVVAEPVNADLNKAEEMTAITPRGGTYQFVLVDGTKVWLNADSRLSFLSDLGKSGSRERKVELLGEAYFEVAKDKRHPFIVESKGQRVEVLGTHFNINSYEDESSTRTTLLEGSVKINQAILKPGEQAVLTGKQLKVSMADTETAMAWKNGDFIFNGEDFKSTMRKIARWYDVDIVYGPDLKENIELGGWVSRKSNLSEVLGRIESAGNVHFKVEGRRVLVTN